MMKKGKLIFYISTGLLTALMIMSAGMYIFNNAEVTKIFTSLGFPTFIIYPLAILKVLGLLAIWTNKSAFLKEWAYAGFFFDFVLALAAHLAVNDGDFMGAVVALVLLLVSYIMGKKVAL